MWTWMRAWIKKELYFCTNVREDAQFSYPTENRIPIRFKAKRNRTIFDKAPSVSTSVSQSICPSRHCLFVHLLDRRVDGLDEWMNGSTSEFVF
jgi:hypothetical protein